MHMKNIRKRMDILKALSAISAMGVACFAVCGLSIPTLCFAISLVVVMALLLQQRKTYRAARLILESQIFSTNCGGSETVLSTFGLLDGERVYPWGYEDTKLCAVEITPNYLFLSFGSKDAPSCLLLPHEFHDQQTVSTVKQRLRHETGVEASVCGFAG